MGNNDKDSNCFVNDGAWISVNQSKADADRKDEKLRVKIDRGGEGQGYSQFRPALRKGLILTDFEDIYSSMIGWKLGNEEI